MLLNKLLIIAQLAVILYGVSTLAHPVIKLSKVASLKDVYAKQVDAEEGFCSRSDAIEELKADENPIGCGSYQPSWTVSQMMNLKPPGGAIALPKDLPTLLKIKQQLYYRIPGMATYKE